MGKFSAYKQLPSLSSYVLVSQSTRRIKVRTLTPDGWQTHAGGCGESVSVHGRTFAVDSIYE